MRVVRIRIERLRNIKRAELELSPEQNLLIGGNGQGKTTVLEAIYLLGAIRSFRGSRPSELVQHGEHDSLVRGFLGVRRPYSEVVVTLTREGRRVQVDGKRVEMVSHFSRFPIVAFHPGDLDLVFGGPSVRRRFLDRMLFQAEAGYAQWFREYRRGLASRNELLREDGSDREIRAYDQVLSNLGARIGEARLRLSGHLTAAASEVLERLDIDPFEIRLKSKVEPKESSLLEALEDSLGRDRRRGSTSVGPHTDDLELYRRTGMAKVVASRGEARALAVALRLGERLVIAECVGAMPLLLLDDVWAELDKKRSERVLEMVASDSGQVVVTGTEASEPIAVSGWRRFEVLGGKISNSPTGSP